MLIQYKANGSKRNVRDSVGRALIARKLATGIYDTREMTPEQLPSTSVLHAEVGAPSMSTSSAKFEDQPNFGPTASRPKRQYRRRDMQAKE